MLVTDPAEVLRLWSSHFASLATPKPNPKFDDQYQRLVDLDLLVIQQLCEESGQHDQQVTEAEVIKAVDKLNSGKAADIYRLCPEHIKYSTEASAPHLAVLLDAILQSAHIPQELQRAFVLPVHKRGKDPLSMDNYRGITITPIISKVLEHVIPRRVEPTLPQSDLQFGFTRGTSPSHAALIVTEAIAEARDLRRPVFMIALDVKKAFDTVDHASLLRKLYNQGIGTLLSPSVWCWGRRTQSRWSLVKPCSPVSTASRTSG